MYQLSTIALSHAGFLGIGFLAVFCAAFFFTSLVETFRDFGTSKSVLWLAAAFCSLVVFFLALHMLARLDCEFDVWPYHSLYDGPHMQWCEPQAGLN